ncbi:MAG: O-methyltransferase [Bacteroidota bacterium]|jgi:caffeoyl-CoA O-methyltransferase
MDFINDEIIQYSNSLSKAEDSVLKELDRETHLKFLSPRMLSGHLQGNLLTFISKLIKPKNILEIGTFTGYSAICLAKGLAENGKLTTIDANPEIESIARKYFEKSGLQNKINLLIGNAIELIPCIYDKFNLVFIDADKKNYSNYFDLIIEKVESGGIIIADNVLWSGKVLKNVQTMDKETLAIHQFNAKIQNDNRVENLLLPIRDGIMLIRKK